MSTAAELLKLKAGHTEVAIAPHRGALVTSFRVGERELLYLDEATFNDPSKNVRGGIPILFPSPGKLDDDRWSYAGLTGELKQHGFARNLNWEVESSAQASATLRLHSTADTLPSFPWTFATTLAYVVTPGALRIEFRVTNTSDSPMPMAFGLHPYFIVENKSRARIPTRATRAFNNVSKTVVAFSGFDLSQDEVDLHLIDHDSTRGTLELSDGASIAIETSPEFMRWIVWTVAGKDYVCLEPWTASGNALNTGEGLIVLEPEETRVLWTRISLEVARV